jgi:hypothetical protein
MPAPKHVSNISTSQKNIGPLLKFQQGGTVWSRIDRSRNSGTSSSSKTRQARMKGRKEKDIEGGKKKGRVTAHGSPPAS